MPLYEYLCSTCGHRFEVRQGIKEPSLTTCSECAGSIRRVVHPVGIVFKGSGFYKTDSRSTTTATGPAAERKSGDTAAPAAEATASTAATSSPSETKSASPSGDTAARPAVAS